MADSDDDIEIVYVRENSTVSNDKNIKGASMTSDEDYSKSSAVSTPEHLVIVDSVESEEENDSTSKAAPTERLSSEVGLNPLSEEIEKQLKILRDENIKLKNQVNNLLTTKTISDNLPAVQISFRNSVLAKKYRADVEKFLRILLSKEDDTFIYSEENKGGQLQFFQDFCVDNINHVEADNEPISQPSWSIPVYDQNYVIEETVIKPSVDNSKSNLVTCFNCSGNHTVDKCPERLDRRKISENRRKYTLNRSNSNRYHEEVDQNSKYKPGIISEELRRALSIEPYQLPLYIYHMRILGYPPGWLKMAEVESSGLIMYDPDGNPIDDLTEDGEIDTTSIRIQYDPKKLIDYPGFNVPLPQGFIDEYKTLRMPTMKFHQLRSETEKKMKAPEANPYKKRKFTTKSDIKTKYEKLEHHQDMDVDSLGTELIILDDKDTCEFIPPLPPDSKQTDRPPPPPSEEDYTSTSSDQEKNRSGTSSPTLIDLEDAKRRLMQELETTSESENDPNGRTNCSKKNTKIASDKGQYLNKKSNECNKSTSVSFGTPVPDAHSPYGSLPDASQFSLGVSDHTPFENLPNSTGTFEKMKSVLLKVRQKIQDLN